MRRIGCIVVLMWSVLALPAHAAIEVVEDETIFMLDAPGATSVYLVGSFNNWNPTLEKMERIGDTYQTLLFISPGIYQYQFVVDGEWMLDPDRSHVGKEGSLVVLEDRGGVLVDATEDYLARTEPQTGVMPGVRYAGRFRNDDGESTTTQDLDLYVGYEGQNLRARANLKTIDEVWQFEPFTSGLRFDRGMLAVSRGKASFRAFENDSSWTSSDPFHLVGYVGIFDYNAGFERKGLTFELLDVGGTHFRAMVADKLDTYPTRPLTLTASAFGDFASSAAADTTVYGYADNYDDADTWGLEFYIDQKNWGVGFGKRRNNGVHDGLVTEVERQGSGFDLTTATSREMWDANVLWGRSRFIDVLTVDGGFGYSNTQLRTNYASTMTSVVLDSVTIAQEVETFETRTRFQTSQRAHFRVDYANGDGGVGLRYNWNQFDFDAGLYAPSAAFIDDYELAGRYGKDDWQSKLFVSHLSQRYGDTPVDMHYFTPSRNYWLDYQHKLDPANIVRFDMSRATTLGGDFVYNPRPLFAWGAAEEHASLTFYADAELVFDEIFGSLEYASVEFGAERGIYRRLYAQVDGRVAHYDKQSWMVNETYLAPYVELGYRHGNVEISAGFGQDPVVLDRVLNMYFRNGRVRRLANAVPPGVTRDQADEMGAALQAEEQRLSDDQTLKLEVIVRF